MSGRDFADVLGGHLTGERTQAWLARELDITRQSVGAWLLRKTNASDTHRRRIVGVLGLDSEAALELLSAPAPTEAAEAVTP
jgi:cyanate lyase